MVVLLCVLVVVFLEVDNFYIIMKIKLLILLLSLFIISCDPPHYIDFVNQTNSNVKVKLKYNSLFKNYDLDEIATGDSIVLNIKSKETSTIYFGIGNWSDDEIHEVTKSLKNIEIETFDIKKIYKTEKSIENLLITNRKGYLFKSKIQINIE